MNVGIYIRLSDEDKLKEETAESESIKNQRNILLTYIKNHSFHFIKEYVDDGYTGTDFNRPSFQEMIKDIEKGVINCVLVKDLSRFGREHIEVGYYLEKYFPLHNIRLISVLDNYDSSVGSNSDIVPFKALLNDMYSKDISKKVRSALRSKMQEGKYIGARAPYGYQKDKNDKNHLVIDEYASQVVKRIFHDYLNGKGQTMIAKELTDEKIEVPSNYNFTKSKVDVRTGIWTSTTISNILRNVVYKGCLAQHKSEIISYKVHKKVNLNQEEYVIVENTHEAIIDEDMFCLVQKKLEQKSRESCKKYEYLLTGLMKCKECGHAINVMPHDGVNKNGEKNFYTFCSHNRHHHGMLCSRHSNNYRKLEECVLIQLKEILSNQVIYYDYMKEELTKNDKTKEKELNLLKNKFIAMERKQSILYDDRLNEIISIEDYVRKNNQIEEEKQNIKKIIQEIEVKKVEMLNYEELTKNLIKLENPDKLLLQSLIDVIYINENKEIELCLNFGTI